MRLSEGVEWALHACTMLAVLPAGTALPASRIAEFHGVPAAYLAKHLQALSAAGILETARGPRGGYRLARPAGDITLLDVVDAIEGDDPAFRCTEIRRRGPASLPAREYRVACTIARAMWRAEDEWRAALGRQTVADIVTQLARDIPPRAVAKGAAWLQEVLP